MSRVTRACLLAPLLTALLTALLATAGCAGSDDPAAAPATDEPRPAPSHDQPTPEPEPSVTPTSQPSPEARRRQRDAGAHKIAPTLPLARPDGARAHLLLARQLPPLATTVDWTVSETAAESADPTGACQKTALVDLGALHAVRRDFAGPEGSTANARQIVARFADARSAWRAQQVLAAWRDDCEDRLDYRRKEVGPMRDVVTEPGTGGRYRLAYGSRRAQRAAELGIVRSGSWLTIVEIAADRGDYPTDRNPASRAVRRIATTFGAA